MSYIGSTPTTQNFIAGTDQFTGTGSQTNWTLSRFVNSVNDIQVTVANVVQNPTSYSVSGNTLTISPAVGSAVAIYVRYLSTTLQSITPPGGTTVNGNWGVNGDLNFYGSARRITGDFSNATVANRVMFQTSTSNGATSIYILPNGTSPTSQFVAVNNSDPTNAGILQAQANSTEIQLRAGITGTGTYLPMTFYTGGSERMRIDTSGNLQFNSGYGSVATAYGCRAWVNFNGTGTVAIRASGNVTSITDNGTGDYTVNFTTAMPDANYSILAVGSMGAGYSEPRIMGNTTTSPTTTSCRLLAYNLTGGSVFDPVFACAAFFR